MSILTERGMLMQRFELFLIQWRSIDSNNYLKETI